jgi:hypothetical protein
MGSEEHPNVPQLVTHSAEWGTLTRLGRRLTGSP